MGQRYNINLILILVLLALVIWIALPSNPGIHIGNFNRSLKTQLGLDLRGGLRVLLQSDTPDVTADQLNNAKQILENRANGLGVSEVTFQIAGNNRIVGEFPGLTNTSEVISVLKETGRLAFVPLGANPTVREGDVINVDYSMLGKPLNEILNAPQPTAAPTKAATAAPTTAGTPEATPSAAATPTDQHVYYAIMTGADLDPNGLAVSRDTLGKPIVNFTLKAEGAKIFSDYTSAHVGDILAIVLDGKVISAPQVQSAITGGQGQISGNFTTESANALRINLQYGALPIPLKVVQSSQVGATLGQDSIDRSVRAGVIGLIMVIAFMILSYRLPGVLASLALGMYALTTFALYKLIPVTLTLPGIAGFVLSIGVAVDANILIFERMKEELRAGRNLRQAVDLGWQRAWSSIRDSNITTLITCAILFWYGSEFGASIIKGFALTLALGVLVSLFTAVVVTRTFLHIVLDNLKFTEHQKWFAA